MGLLPQLLQFWNYTVLSILRKLLTLFPKTVSVDHKMKRNPNRNMLAEAWLAARTSRSWTQSNPDCLSLWVEVFFFHSASLRVTTLSFANFGCGPRIVAGISAHKHDIFYQDRIFLFPSKNLKILCQKSSFCCCHNPPLLIGWNSRPHSFLNQSLSRDWDVMMSQVRLIKSL